MQIDLTGKTALITGASRGIGFAMASTYAAAGANVVLSSRKQDDLDSAVERIAADTGAPERLAAIAANAGDPEAAASTVAATVERFGAVDVLINNAATNPYMGAAIDIDLPRYDKTFEVNLRGPLVWAQEAHRASMSASGGVVINVASIGGMSIEPGIGVYNTTKAALIHLTKVLAAEIGPAVRVNGIAPGLVKTDMARALWEPNEDAIGGRMPLGRLGEPQDIANAALFLGSDLSSWMTGHVLVVDGGGLLA